MVLILPLVHKVICTLTTMHERVTQCLEGKFHCQGGRVLHSRPVFQGSWLVQCGAGQFFRSAGWWSVMQGSASRKLSGEVWYRAVCTGGWLFLYGSGQCFRQLPCLVWCREGFQSSWLVQFGSGQCFKEVFWWSLVQGSVYRQLACLIWSRTVFQGIFLGQCGVWQYFRAAV